MDLKLPNFTIIDLLYESEKTIVCRAVRNVEGAPTVIIKVPKKESSVQQHAQLQYEYDMLQKIDSPHVIKALGLEKCGPYSILILEDIGGISLSTLIKKQKIDLNTFFKISIELSQGLGEIHHHQVIHKDIKPENILINLQTENVLFTDFGISTFLTRERQQIVNPNLLVGSIGYISPEQTGRINRAVDYRTDIYSLGITLYEMAVGQLPFQSDNPMEMVYLQITKMAVQPHKMDSNIPEEVSNIILKCLAKDAEERYHSAFGLKNDLEECYRQINELGYVASFVPGQKDVYDQFHIPQKLYGREQEIEFLFSIFDSCSVGQATLLLVTGYSGIGKSSIIHEVQRAIAQKKGLFIEGKFDQFRKNIPFDALIQAFQALIEKLLTESSTEIDKWKDRILNAVGTHGEIICEVIPELKYIIGEQPAVEAIDPESEAHRFQITFSRFIEVFLKKEHPLIIFLDDMQWADSSSLKMVETLISDSSHHHLLIIGAYRDNEVDHMHPLMEMIKNIQLANGLIKELKITPLTLASIKELIKDSFHTSSQQIDALAQLVHSKTKGNPFFIYRLLKMLYEDKLINFDPVNQCWVANLESIYKLQVTDNVADLVAKKLDQMPEALQSMLQVAAAIGHTFELKIIADIHKMEPVEAAKILWLAIQEELILPEEDYQAHEHYFFEKVMDKTLTYTFQHDRIQHAAYQLIPPNKRNQMHFEIGKTLLKHTPEEHLQDSILEIVNQLNYGIEFLQTDKEKEELAHLNLAAGKKAKDATAYTAATVYLNAGIQLLSKDCWNTQYNLSYALHENLLICEFLIGNILQADKVIDLVIKHAKFVHEKLQMFDHKIDIFNQTLNFQASLQASLEALKLCNQNINVHPSNLAMAWEWFKIKKFLFFHTIESIKGWPLKKDTDPNSLGYLYFNLWLPSLVLNMKLNKLSILKAANLILSNPPFGEDAPEVLASLSILLASESIQEYKKAFDLGKAAIHIANRFKKNIILGRFYSYCYHWNTPFSEAIVMLKDVENKMFEMGKLSQAFRYVNMGLYFRLMKGDPLDLLHEKIKEGIEISIKKCFVKNSRLDFLLEFCIVLRNLKSNTSDPLPANFQYIATEKVSEGFNFLLQLNYNSFQMFLLYIYERYEEALVNIEKMDPFIHFYPGYILWLMYHFNKALVLCALCSNPKHKKKYWQQLKEVQKRIQKWSDACPMNHLHKHLLISAEIARLQQNGKEAEILYDKAIETAIRNGFLQDTAIANELAAKYYIGCGKNKIASVYMQEAFHYYNIWGATIKTIQLKDKYQEFLQSSQGLKQEIPTSITMGTFTREHPTITTISSRDEFDFTSITQALQTISGEIVLDKLLSKMMHIVMVNAAADKAFFILSKDDKLTLQAEMLLGEEKATLLYDLPLEEKKEELSITIINYVQRSKKEVLLSDAAHEGSFIEDPYMKKNHTASLLCLPLIHRGNFIGILYLENQAIKGAFTPQRSYILSLLSSQIAISIENALFYANLEAKVEERTQKIKQMQDQLFQQQKMASLGLLTAGIAHELRNPLNFVINFSELSTTTLEGVLESIDKIKKDLPIQELENITSPINEIKTNISAIYQQGKRADSIINNMLSHSAATQGEFFTADIYPIIENAIELAYQETKSQDLPFDIEIKREYDRSINQIKIAPQEMKLVFVNIFKNSFYTLIEKKHVLGNAFTPILTIKTSKLNEYLEIRIKDNGMGIPSKNYEKIFTPFFTTKPPGKGTGLGLSLSYNIITELHRGKLSFNSKEGEFTEMVISLRL